MDSESLTNFLRILRGGTITSAVKDSGKTQSGLSRQMQALEEEVGVTLFERAGRGISATAAGRAIAETAESVLHQWEDAVNRARAEAGREVKSLRLAASVTTTLYLLPEILGRFRKAYPDRALQMRNAHSAEILEWLRRGEVDTGIVAVTEAPQEFEFTPYKTLHLGILASPDEKGTFSRVEDLEGMKFAYPRRGLVGVIIRDLLEETGVKPDIVAEADNLEVVKTLVRDGFGVSVVPDICVRDEVKEGRFRWWRLEGQVPDIRIGAVVLKGRYIRKAVLDFLDVLKKGG